MKILAITLLCGAVAALFCAGCSGCAKKDEPADVKLKKPVSGKVLVVYYSESANKNTKAVAEWIHELAGGDIFEIEMETPYPDGYIATLRASKKDMDSKTLPPIKPFGKNIEDYDIVFVGSPIWYGTYAPPVGTFFADVDMKDKTIVPFCTHGGGGAGTFYSDIAEECTDSKVLDGLTVKGSNIVERKLGRGTKNKASKSEVAEWLDKLSL